MPRVYNQDRGVILKGALAVMGISIKEAAIAIGRGDTPHRINHVSRILKDEAESNPIITEVTRFVLDEAKSRGSDVVLGMIDWEDELELESVEETNASGAEAA